MRRRYPWYAGWVERAERDPASPLADALAAARRALLGLTVGVDALCLGPDRMGTQQIVVDIDPGPGPPARDRPPGGLRAAPPARLRGRALRTELPGGRVRRLEGRPRPPADRVST